jgi:hypothetical protein
LTEKVERDVLRVPLERALLLKVMGSAAQQGKLPTEWVKGLIEAALADVPT